MTIVEAGKKRKARAPSPAPASPVTAAPGPPEPSPAEVAAAAERDRKKHLIQLCIRHPSCGGMKGGCGDCRPVYDTPPAEAAPAVAGAVITTKAEIERLRKALDDLAGGLKKGIHRNAILCGTEYFVRMAATLRRAGIALVLEQDLKAHGHVLNDGEKPAVRVTFTARDIRPAYVLHVQTRPAT